jgi:hypothetical protein
MTRTVVQGYFDLAAASVREPCLIALSSFSCRFRSMTSATIATIEQLCFLDPYAATRISRSRSPHAT